MARRQGPARGKQHTTFQKGGFTFETDKGFESLLMKSGKVEALVAAKTAELTAKMIKAAPRGPHVHTDEFSIKKNVHGYIDNIGSEWVGYIVVEENERARHAMLQERGYRDPAGRRHKGRFFFKKVLESEALDDD
ncbi:hypothetical protein ACWEVY_28635 [Streptomyces longwoodensis]